MFPDFKIPKDGRIVLYVKDHTVISAETLRNDEHVVSIQSLFELLAKARFFVLHEDGIDKCRKCQKFNIEECEACQGRQV